MAMPWRRRLAGRSHARRNKPARSPKGIDKPMKAHTLMQAIARANRVYPGKDFGLIADYNGMLARALSCLDVAR